MTSEALFGDIIALLANLSFSEGGFPTKFKQASVTPLLKGHSLDKSVPSDYGPISNLNFISKIIERLFLAHFQAIRPLFWRLQSPHFNKYQFAYRPGCSTETALQLLMDRIFSTSDEGTLLVSLDLSAAFDMIDYAVLLERLTCSFGVTGTVHSWIESYLCGRSQSVRIGGHSSSVTSCLWVCLKALCASRLCPWATTLFYLHLTSGNNSSSTQRFPAAVCR